MKTAIRLIAILFWLPISMALQISLAGALALGLLVLIVLPIFGLAALIQGVVVFIEAIGDAK